MVSVCEEGQEAASVLGLGSCHLLSIAGARGIFPAGGIIGFDKKQQRQKEPRLRKAAVLT